MRVTTVQTLAAYLDDEITAMPNLVTTAATTVGVLGSGSIAAGFGNIDNGASNITSGGLVKLDVDVDADDVSADSATGRLTIGASEDLNLYHGGTHSYIVNDTGNLVIDTAGDLTFDAAGNDFKFLANGTEILNITNSSSDVIIKPLVDAKDIIFHQRDGTEVLRLDDDTTVKVATDLTVGDDVGLVSDAAALTFGADSEVTLTHVADVGLALKSIATADDKPVKLTLQTGETDMAANDVIGAVDFQAPNEGTGTDAILVAAGIEAVAEGDFSSSSNATSLVFKTGASEAAAGKIKVTSAGHLFPMADDSYDLGGSSNQWRNIYTGDLHLSNMSKAEGNVVDGTKGDWTIQEGSDELYLMNNNSGKKYKFNLTEV